MERISPHLSATPPISSDLLRSPPISSDLRVIAVSRRISSYLVVSRCVTRDPPRVSSQPQCGARLWTALTCSRPCGPSRRPSRRSCGALERTRSGCPTIPRLVSLTSAAGCSRGAWGRHRSRTRRRAARHPARAAATRSAAGECGVAVEEGGRVPKHDGASVCRHAVESGRVGYRVSRNPGRVVSSYYQLLIT